MIDYIADNYGDVYSDSLNERIVESTRSLTFNPERHMRIRHLVGRQFIYRRALVGKKRRLIFTIDEPALRVEVVRIDFQSSDPRTLDDLPWARDHRDAHSFAEAKSSLLHSHSAHYGMTTTASRTG